MVELGRMGVSGFDARSESGERAVSAAATEQRAAEHVDSDEPGRAAMLMQVFATAAQCAGGAGCDEQVVEIAVEGLVDLLHRAGGMGGRVGAIGVLVGAKAVRRLAYQLGD